MLVIGFEWDPRNEKTNRLKHGAGFAEACTVFDDGLAKIFPDVDHSETETREIIVGQSNARRLLLVSFYELVPGEVRIISALGSGEN